MASLGQHTEVEGESGGDALLDGVRGLGLSGPQLLSGELGHLDWMFAWHVSIGPLKLFECETTYILLRTFWVVAVDLVVVMVVVVKVKIAGRCSANDACDEPLVATRWPL